jgi:hypothetical protein
MKQIFLILYTLITLYSCVEDPQKLCTALLQEEDEKQQKALSRVALSTSSPWHRDAFLIMDLQQSTRAQRRAMRKLFYQGDNDPAFLRLLFREHLLNDSKDLKSMILKAEESTWQQFYLQLYQGTPLDTRQLLQLPQGEELEEADILLSRGYALLEDEPQNRMILDLRLALLKREYGQASQIYEDLLNSYVSWAQDPMLLYHCWYPIAQRSDWNSQLEKLIQLPADPHLSFAIGRIYRYRQQWTQAENWFSIAPLGDRSLWYRIDCLLNQENAELLPQVMESITSMDDLSYFDDQLQQLLYLLISYRDWAGIKTVLIKLLEKEEGFVTSRYIWVMARLQDRGLYDSELFDSQELYRLAVQRDPLGWYGMLAGWVGDTDNPTLEELPEEIQELKDLMNFQASRSRQALPESFLKSPDMVLMSLIYRGMDDLALEYSNLRKPSLSYWSVPTLVSLQLRQQDYYDSIHSALWGEKQDHFIENKRHLQYLHPLGFPSEVKSWAQYYALDPWMIHGIIRVESAYDSNIVSRSGAVGLMQLMEPTAMEHGDLLGLSNPDFTDPGTNIRIGGAYIIWLLNRPYVENLSDMLIAYNGGPGNLQSWKNRMGDLPPEIFAEAIPYSQSREYSRLVFTAVLYYGYLYGNISPEDSLERLIPQYRY